MKLDKTISLIPSGDEVKVRDYFSGENLVGGIVKDVICDNDYKAIKKSDVVELSYSDFHECICIYIDTMKS